MRTADPDSWRVERTGALVERGAISRLAQAVGDPNPLWHDHAAAGEAGFPDVVAPPTFVDTQNPFYAGEPYPVWGGLPHFFSAGDAFDFHAPICAGDVLDVTCRIERIREGTRGDGHSAMRFITYLKEYTRAGEPVCDERWTCVLFEGDRTATPSPAPPRSDWADHPLGVEERIVDPSTIVRWTAASGDFERIHFDHVYAVEECGLPGIVGHGPYSAAVLLKLVTDRLDDPGRLAHAEFRYRSPLYAGDAVTFAGFADGDPRDGGAGRSELVATRSDGSVVTTGTATWREGRRR